MSSIAYYIKACRPTQWVKNGLVFAGLIFAVQFTDPTQVTLAFAAFAAFCFLSSAVYLFNDVQDIEFDRIHPKKKNRPIAAGHVSVSGAITLSVILTVVALAISFRINGNLGVVAVIYLVMNVLYSKVLKKLVIIDIMTIAIGFVLRAVAGAYAINVSISPWLLICTILLALFLGFSKRRHEIILLDKSASSHRYILDQYSLPFLDQMISVTTASALMAYILYTLSIGDHKFPIDVRLEFTIPFVIYGIFRYLYIVYQKSEGGSPTESLLTDIPVLINIGLWLATIGLLYFLS